MAYSMNWRPELDEIERSTPSRDVPANKLGPIPGLLPPSRYAPPSSVRPSIGNTRATGSGSGGGSSSYSMNWRPKYEDEEDEEENTHAGPSGYSTGGSGNAVNIQTPFTPEAALAAGTSNGQQIRVSLANECPAVQHIGSSSFICSQSGLSCTLERQPGVPSIGVPEKWTVAVHPSRQDLSHHQVVLLTQTIYCCLYAASSKNGKCTLNLVPAISQPFEHGAQSALLRLGLPLDLSLPISWTILLQLYAYAEQHLQPVHQPYLMTQSFNGSRRPVAHPIRPPVRPGSSSRMVYSRLEPSTDDYVCISESGMRKGSQLRLSRRSQRQIESDSAPLLSVTLSWALEDPILEPLAEGIDDYDQVIHFENLSNDAEWEVASSFLHSLCHYTLLKENRGRRVWVICSQKQATNSFAWSTWEEAKLEDQAKSGIKVLSIAQRPFWSSI